MAFVHKYLAESDVTHLIGTYTRCGVSIQKAVICDLTGTTAATNTCTSEALERSPRYKLQSNGVQRKWAGERHDLVCRQTSPDSNYEKLAMTMRT